MAVRNEYDQRSMERIRWLIDTYCDGSQVAFCERTGLHKSTVSKIVHNTNVPSKESSEKIANAFFTSMEWIQGYDVPMRPEKPSAATEALPVYTRIPASLPLGQILDVNGTVEYAKDAMQEGETCFAFEIPDDSMQPRILTGDVVIASAMDEAASDDLVIAAVDEKDAVLRRLKIYENSVALIADNPAVPPQYFTDAEKDRIRIIGKVKELRASF